GMLPTTVPLKGGRTGLNTPSPLRPDMNGFLVPRGFFVVSGEAHEGASALNAFDLALKDAGITQCNLVEVSSILPHECQEVEPVDIPTGAVTFCVMAKMAGTLGERIGCGLAWAWGTTGSGERYGIVAEHHGSSSSGEIERMLMVKLERMAEVRGMRIEDPSLRTRSMVCEGNYGCVVATLVFVP
ncbi:MAG: pyruvoyl-dependent arginine decarboxylase, partial [Thermoplasmata archaeon]|nr:pyruvoyl-dependent arginine decarboxylase [Thermoplasmata archaeon]